VRDMLCLQANTHGFEQISIINFILERSPERKKAVEDLAKLLGSGKQFKTKYLESLLHSNFGMYQMNYEEKYTIDLIKFL
jgi:hypothetical protein